MFISRWWSKGNGAKRFIYTLHINSTVVGYSQNSGDKIVLEGTS